MRSVPIVIGAAALAGLLWLAPGRTVAQPRAQDPLALRKAQDEFARLQEQLDGVNAEIARLKRSNRSVRDDYRLRDRMADAEALAQKLTRVEARLRSLGAPAAPRPQEGPLLAPLQVSPQDGSLELEAKADLFADQASKLAKQAAVFEKAAEQLRARRILRRRAGAWDRDPFAGLESSKRSLAVAQATQKGAAGGGTSADNGTRSGTAPTGAPPPTTTESGAGAGPAADPVAATPGGTTFDGSGNSSPTVGTLESPASKSSPLAPGLALDRQVDQRLYLDPTIAAELRHALSSAVANADPDALERAAATLRARARSLEKQAETLRSRSRRSPGD
jgi:hypothetical protein